MDDQDVYEALDGWTTVAHVAQELGVSERRARERLSELYENGELAKHGRTHRYARVTLDDEVAAIRDDLDKIAERVGVEL